MVENKTQIECNRNLATGDVVCEFLRGNFCQIYIRYPHLINYGNNRLRYCTQINEKKVKDCERIRKMLAIKVCKNCSMWEFCSECAGLEGKGCEAFKPK